MEPNVIKTLLLILLPIVVSFSAIAAQPTAPLENENAQTTSSSNKTTITVQKRPKISKPKPQEYYINSDIERYFQPDELIKLLAGEQDFYALFRDDLTGRPRGVAILIPDWGLHAANNRGIESLRTHLPDLGWVTLSMTVPSTLEPVHIHKVTNKVNSEQSNTENSTSAPAQNASSSTSEISNSNAKMMPYKVPKPLRILDESQFQQYELNIKLRLQALINEAQNHQGYFIVIAQGSSAAAVASIYAKEELELPEALILLSPNLPDRTLASKMNQDITINSIPTLDIFSSSSSRSLLQSAKLRRKLAKKNFKVSYRQQKVFGDISQFNRNRKLLKSVYGWLSSLGL